MGMRIKPRKKGVAKKSRYRLVPGQTDAVRERARQTYRKNKGREFELEGNVVLRALEFIEEESTKLPVFNQLTNTVEVLPVLRLTHAAKLLNVSYQTLWRWTSETKQVPMPVLVDSSSGREYAVYHVDEVRVMIRIIGDHLTRFRYYRSDHESARGLLFAEINALRALNFGNTGKTEHGNQEKRSRPVRKGKVGGKRKRPRRRGA